MGLKKKCFFIKFFAWDEYETLHGFVFIDMVFGSAGFVKKDWPVEAKKTHVDSRLKFFLKGQYHEEIIKIIIKTGH